MATYNPQRFANISSLKSIAPDRLIALLRPFEDFLNGRGVKLAQSANGDERYYRQLADVLMTPDVDTPAELLKRIFLVHEMATPEAMDGLLEAAANRGLVLATGSEASPADVAVQALLQAPDLLERKHLESYLNSGRSFTHFQSATRKPLPPRRITPTLIAGLESDLAGWFEKKRRGRVVRVIPYRRDDEVWFLVLHGDPYRREGSIEGTQSSAVHFRPEKHDVVIYDNRRDELRINAGSLGERELYCLQFGRHLFGRDAYFPATAKFTLEPLRRDGAAALACADIRGMESAVLREIQFYWGGAQNEVEVRKADDVMALYGSGHRRMPERAKIIRASFRVKFTDAKAHRMITIRPPNVALYTRDDDAAIVEEWLVRRRFVNEGKEDGRE